ncbi:hypothetical protein ACNPQN_32695 [Streptomyces sp. NPDC056297]|uniref:hypothetical protein n=1 Tax=unclassified Streptomyces TaxID=2593676 RepID=UPI0035D7953F
MAADEVPAQAAPATRLTARQALQFDDSLYRRFTALHEAGHAIVALATGEASVSECVIAPTETTSEAGTADAYTDVSWDSATAHLTLLYGGGVAQQRWLHEQQLWSPLRESAVATLANHDYAALEATEATSGQLWQAYSTALALRDRHWHAIIAASALLDQNGRITGDEINALLSQTPATAQEAVPPTLISPQVASFSTLMARAKQIAGESQHRASRIPEVPAPLTHDAQPASLYSQQRNHRHMR